jgi:multidrug efflux system membrane fusion protein
MKIVSIITAIVVIFVLYTLVFEREAFNKVADGTDIKRVVEERLEEENLATKVDLEEDSAQQTDKNAELVSVVVYSSNSQNLGSSVILRGETEAARFVQVRAETFGQVISDPLRKGSFVQKDDILCRLDEGTRKAALADSLARLEEAKALIPQTEAKLGEANSRLEEAKINFNAASKLSEGGYASDTRVASVQAAMRSAEAGVATAAAGFDSTRARIQSAEAGVATAKKEIERLTITAPFEGALESDTAEIGSLLQPGDLCGTIIQLNPIKLVGFLPETELFRVKLGANVRAQLTSGQEIEGNVTFLSRSADSKTRTFRVEVNVPNDGLEIRDGQTVELAIGSDGKKAHLLPQSALTLNDDGLLGVRFVDDKNITRFAAVKLEQDSKEGVGVRS